MEFQVMKQNSCNQFKKGISLQKQQGVVLVISMILLFVMTGLVLASVNSTRLEERMAGATRDMNFSFQAAESALKDAENYLTSAILPPFNDTNGLYQASTSGDDLYEDGTVDWTAAGECVPYSGTAIPNVQVQPCYYIEELNVVIAGIATGGGSITIGGGGAPSGVTGYYRVTARGVGVSNNSETIVQSVFKR